MSSRDLTHGAARWLVLGALFLIPVIPLIVVNGLFFPFITAKAFTFRILVEVAVAGWAVLAFLDAHYRPRFSWIGVVVCAFVVWMGFADLFAVNVAKAFWSNFERMEGWVLLIHLLGLFVVMSATLRAEKKWRAWFLTSLSVSLLVSGYALLQLSGAFAIHQGSTRIDASFGNSAYLAIYFLFNVCIAFWLALTERYVWLKYSLITLASLEAVLIFFTETRGTILGLVAAAGLAALLTAFTAGKRARSYASGALAILILIIGTFYVVRDSSFVQQNHILQRIASISPSDGQVRFMIWGMAFEGMKERPIVGWGQEGFNYVFNTYYNPGMYAQEQWFDRAHNAFIDWLLAGGIPAFLLYVALFGSGIVLLWRRSELSRPERIALTAALVGYAIHNLFVFDNLYSYIYFFAILALIDSQVGRPFTSLEEAPELGVEDTITYVVPIATVVGLVAIWTVNITGITIGTTLITALSSSPQGLDGNLATFEELTAHPGFGIQEVREQLVSLATILSQNASVTADQKKKFSDLAIAEMKKQNAAYPLDARGYLELSYAYRAAGDGQDALAAIEQARVLSPKKESILIEKGALEWQMGSPEAALEDFTAAYALGPQFQELAIYAAAGNYALGKTVAGDKILQDAYGTTTVDSDTLANAYAYAKNWPRVIAFWKARAQVPGADVQTWFSLAAAYYQSGDRASAIQVLTQAGTLFPDAQSSVTAAIKQIQSGQ